MKNTTLYQISEVKDFMMSFVIVTKNDNVIIIDGGRCEDMPRLKEYVSGRHVSAWILTHPHFDHISGLVSEVAANGLRDFDVDKIIFNFPPYDELIARRDLPNYKGICSDLNDCLPQFNAIYPMIKDKCFTVSQGESIMVDEVRIEFIFSYHPEITTNLINNSSLVFKAVTPNKSVIFLGDIGPDAGDILYFESEDRLKSDIVQMAHHGGLGCSMEVYAAIDPQACLWCCPESWYNGEYMPKIMYNREKLKEIGWIRMHGISITRRWMEQLGVREHYVTKDGTNTIYL